MALHGTAFLAMWHDIEPSAQERYMEWHTREHMPERLSIPGFTLGKRLINHDLDRYRYGTIYAGRSLEVFRSASYLERLNNPTEWSNEMQPTFRNFLRMACDRVVSRGIGDGGAMATIRLGFAEGGGEETIWPGAEILADAILAITGVTGVHLGLAREEVSGVRTRETELRPEGTEPGFDAVVLVEGNGRSELENVVPEIEAAIREADCGFGQAETIVYDLAYQLSADQIPAR